MNQSLFTLNTLLGMKVIEQHLVSNLYRCCLSVGILNLALLSSTCLASQTGTPVDVIPFGQIETWDGGGKDYGVIWEDARDIFRVVVTFADPDSLPDPTTVRLNYWQSSWPHSRIPRDRPSGAGGSGWLNVGDWYQGKWTQADTKLEIKDNQYTFTFHPVNAHEFPDLGDFAARYRSTLKLRLVGDQKLPKIDSIEAFTDSIWDRLAFDLFWGGTAHQEQNWDGSLEIFNGIIEKVEPLSATSNVKINAPFGWTSKVQNAMDGIRGTVLYARTDAYNSFDETVVTLRTANETFSFATSDLLKHGHMLLPDFGVLIRKAGDTTEYAIAEQAWNQAKNRSIYARVTTVPEQTFDRAWNAMPDRKRFYIPLSFEGGRQHFGLDPDGSAFCDYGWHAKIQGRDSKQVLYDGNHIRYSFGLSAQDIVNRETIDGCLPMTMTEWQRAGIRYRQTAFVIPLDGVPEPGQRIEAEDALVLMVRFEMEPIDTADREATLDLSVHAEQQESLTVDDGLIFATGGETPCLRMLATSPDPAQSYSLTAAGQSISYRAMLNSGQPKRTLDLAISYITLTNASEWDRLRSIPFDKAFAAVRDYWQSRLETNARITTPVPMINDFYKAHVSHLLINTEREVGGSDRYMAKVGTFHYGVFSNESCMMVSDLDRRGYSKRAEQALDTWLHYQGTVGLPGDFTTTEGQLYGAGGYEHGGYNQHHGFILWCLGEHYWYTRDLEWLRRAAPKIVKGCDWIIGQRQRMIDEADRSPIRAMERGLLPPGYLEDIKDWRSWMSTNVYSWWGMHNAAAALDAAGIPDGQRLLHEADRYRQDILNAFTEAMHRSPVVQLRDGSWIPHIPPEAHRRGRTFGWITETLEGPIHMIRTGLIDPWDRRSTWIIQDYEDNLYLSEQYGYHITGPDFERYWFDRGGISMQANLLCNPISYLLRDEPEHFLRGYFNAFAASYFPDTRMMTEHALPNLGDWRGDHYKASDESNSTYWLRLMFIHESGDDLWLGAAIPRYWLAAGMKTGIENAQTYFGPMALTYESHADRGRIELTIDPPRRNPPKRILARFRHPEKRRITRCLVDGEPYRQFDPNKEWVVLTEWASPTKVVVFYD
ncbi:MAG: hypothetical protein JW829_08065 [Pirellulales bacterium]|nr:hypothetical protein [Pirellulales bacterium]